jgi:hypothetical protein
MADPHSPPPSRRPLSERLQPWAEFLYKMIVASAAAIAIWKGLR